ncbi:MAG: PASTA domain-containing protein [Chloroflexota bacterium]
MTATSGRPALTRPVTWLVTLLLLVLAAPIAPAAAQEPSASPAPTASVGGVLFGAAQAADDGRGPDGDATLVLGGTLDGLLVSGNRNGFAPGEVVAFRLALPAAAGATALTAHLVSAVGDGVEALAGSGAWAVDPAWDTVSGLLPAPPIGQHELRVYRGPQLVASAPVATWDVPRVTGAVTDPQGVVAGQTDQVSAAIGRFADATEGPLWLVILDSTGDIGATDYADRLWAVNEDHLWPGDALAVLTTSDSQVAVKVGTDLGFYVTPDEVDGVVADAQQPTIEGRFADAIDTIADALVRAYDEAPPEPGATPTPRPSPTPETVRTPDLVGLTRAEAQALADEQDLRLRTLFQQTDEAPPGTVIDQDPAAGRPVEILGRVTITVAQAPALVTVPDVVGDDEDDALNTLLDAGLQPGTRSSRTSASVARGDVISTNPRAGVVVQPGSTIDYVVSRGPAASPEPTPRPTATPSVVTVPVLRGMSEADALTELGSVGLRAGDRTRAYSASIDAGDVIRTDPAAGVQVSRGTHVDYVVSRGPEPTPTPTPRPTTRPSPTPTAVPRVTVPDLRGLSEADALTELGSVGLRAGERTRAYHSSIAAGDVISTDPAAGERVREGTAVDYRVSRGPRPTPTPTPRPTPRPTPTPTPRPTVAPTEAPTPAPTETPTGDLLERIQAAGRIVVNIDPSDAPWTRVSDDGTAHGFDVDIANRLADSLGVDIAFTTYPLEQVVTGTWDGRFDIAMQHLAITDARRSVLDFSAPYAFDPTVVVVPAGSSLTSVDELAGARICAARGSLTDEWLSGTLPLTDLPLPAATPPDAMDWVRSTTDSACLAWLQDGSEDVAAGLVGADDAARAIARGDALAVLGDPQYYAPIGIAFDRSGADPTSLEAAVGAALEALRADGTLTARSEARFEGLDLTQVPGGGPIVTPAPGDAPAFGVDDTLVERFPATVGDTALTPVFLSGADLDRLLRPSNGSVSQAYGEFLSVGEGSELGLAALGLAMAPVASDDGVAELTAARMDGARAADLATALTPLLGNQLRSDSQTVDVDLGGKSVARTSSGPYAEGDTALWVYLRSGVAWFVWGTEPLAGEVLAALP